MATHNEIEADLIARIVGEYRQMPGLALTLRQAQRLWNVDCVTSQHLADLLVAQGVLRWSSNRRLIRARHTVADLETHAASGAH